MLTSKNKHMNFNDRLEIEGGLAKGLTFREIAKIIGKDPTTVSKEIKRNVTVVKPNLERFDKNGISVKNEVCPRLLKAPYVCNMCKLRRRQCAYAKHWYYAKQAQKQYDKTLVSSREGIPLNKEEFYKMDKVISKGIKKGQHLYHIIETNKLGVSKSTVYRHLKKGYLSVSAIEFPRVVKFKKRKNGPSEYVPKSLKVGRTFNDFLIFKEKNNISSWTEMDTVIGRIGGKTIMTLNFTFCNFMVGILLENKTSFEASAKIVHLKEKFMNNKIKFEDIIPLLLTDNGGEFSDVFSFENNLEGNKTTNLYFCDPYQSSQKPYVEKNHTHFRDIVPKGESFDNFDQKTVNLIFSHMNSIKRKSLYSKSPYEIFISVFGKKIAQIFGIEYIAPENVIQSPKLILSK